MIKLLGKSKDENIMPPVGSADYRKVVDELYINSTKNEAKFLDDSLYSSITRYDEIADEMSKLKLEKDIIEHTIMGLMKENEIAYIKERKITWKKTNRSRFDTKLLRKKSQRCMKDIVKLVVVDFLKLSR